MKHLKRHSTMIMIVGLLVFLLTLLGVVIIETPLLFVYELKQQLKNANTQVIEDALDRPSITSHFIKQETSLIEKNLEKKDPFEKAMRVMLLPKLLDYLVLKISLWLSNDPTHLTKENSDVHLAVIAKQWLGNWTPSLQSIYPNSFSHNSDWTIHFGNHPHQLQATLRKQSLWKWKVTEIKLGQSL